MNGAMGSSTSDPQNLVTSAAAVAAAGFLLRLPLMLCPPVAPWAAFCLRLPAGPLPCRAPRQLALCQAPRCGGGRPLRSSCLLLAAGAVLVGDQLVGSQAE